MLDFLFLFLVHVLDRVSGGSFCWIRLSNFALPNKYDVIPLLFMRALAYNISYPIGAHAVDLDLTISEIIVKDLNKVISLQSINLLSIVVGN